MTDERPPSAYERIYLLLERYESSRELVASKVAERLGLSSSYTRKLLSDMERAGVLVRRPTEHGQTWWINRDEEEEVAA